MQFSAWLWLSSPGEVMLLCGNEAPGVRGPALQHVKDTQGCSLALFPHTVSSSKN